jgi:plasmid maintenance system antidote protein VapI
MIQRDYILRLIADLAEFIGKLLKLSKGEVPKVFDEITSKIESLYGIDFEVFMKMENESLLKNDWSVTSGIADRLAEFFTVSAKIALDNQRYDVNDNFLRKALYLYNLSESTSKTYSFERVQAIQDIKDKLGLSN